MAFVGQRRFRRFSVNVPCVVKPARLSKAAKNIEIAANTKDISRGGIAFVANAEWKVGTEIECVIQLAVQPHPHKPVEMKCRGKIVRVAPLEKGRIEVGASIEHFSYLPSPEDPEQTARL